jgi:uncharacterized protein
MAVPITERPSHAASSEAAIVIPCQKLSGKRRRCILSRQDFASETLIRFVVGPDNHIVPDLAERLPGRGLWLSAEKNAIEQAQVSKSFAKAAHAAVIVDADLAMQVADLLAARALNFLGLALRSGAVVMGYEKVRADLKAGRAAILVQANDGAPHTRARMRAVASGMPAVELFSRGELSQALGRADTVHAVLHASRLSGQFLCESSRLAGFREAGKSRLPVLGVNISGPTLSGPLVANETAN